MNIPERFKPSRSVLMIDQWMTRFIRFGGMSLIIAVFGICFFILSQVIPLFGGAEITLLHQFKLDSHFKPLTLILDEWGELPLFVNENGEVRSISQKDGRTTLLINLVSDLKGNLTALRYESEQNNLLVGTDALEIAVYRIDYERFQDGDQMQGNPSFHKIQSYSIEKLLRENLFKSLKGKTFITDLAYVESGSRKIIASTIKSEEGYHSYLIKLKEASSLLGGGEVTFDGLDELKGKAGENIQKVYVNNLADAVVGLDATGTFFYYWLDSDGIKLKQSFVPFDEEKPIFADFLLGGNSFYIIGGEGSNLIYSLNLDKNGEERLFQKTKQFNHLVPTSSYAFAKSLRNKAFLVAAEKEISLRYATTENIRWEGESLVPIQHVALSRKYEHLAYLDSANQFSLYKLNDPHPEGGWRTFFGKIWYEGASNPEYAWQSTGGTDDFEPKLSLIPLIFGTLKGTLYAMLFSFPIAFIAALYTSEFLHPRLKKIVKPTMEVMASLPSVILGFIGAFWLAPLLSDRVPSLILILIFLPLVAVFLGIIWAQLPNQLRRILPKGMEFFISIPVLLLAIFLAWKLGPLFELIVFTVIDPTTGQVIADFGTWWSQITGLPFEQRNSLIVGIAMGFAVIPIIFTISEDSLAQVPLSLRSASLACGASRWQTAIRVVVPTAAAGVFSATMVGLGRAVGETMIVLMATGNTPIMEWNIFSGMRTLSANLAVELPEAPFHGTLYRVLFLGGLILFLMTFIVNTIAELLRQYIRERYKTL